MSGNPDDPEKADMRIVQASAQEVRCTYMYTNVHHSIIIC